MTLINYLSFAISPLLIILGALYLRYGLSLKLMGYLRNAVILGMFSVLFVILADYMADLRWHGELRNMRRMAFYVFVGIAFSAEFAKFLALRLSFYRLKSFESPIEGMIYATFIGLGYSMIAVPLFAYGFIGTNLINDLSLFLFTYPLANIVFAICMGYFVGLGKVRKNVFIDKATGVFVATFFHGLFIFSFITKDERLLILTGIGFAIIAIVFISRAVKLRKMQD